ncbi:MAG: response regulator transcription factor [Candidatus Bipolaricaulota bacterium]|nr:response regulator transcription factor [Candidatus Bipolaricaulota bacterium]MCS7274537.1 response regulator transcription factor [Candidatus Bipolaricaulota bacterium]MDW8111218.1 response regulator transcription factor [Candidatus Bipolaricaulota bacterium]MDW8329451.1 response regulator transcription factor [Candidatus Bipolaricaulota bacterium]
MKILVVDDEADIAHLLKRFLETKGRTVLTAANGLEALELFKKESPDLVILDVMLPGMDGWTVLQRIREESEIPVLMLTGRDTPTDAAKGLLSGADDYIAKPFDLAELEARIAAVLRRYKAPSRPSVLKVGDLEIDDNLKQVRVLHRSVSLSPKEYELLKLLASEPGRVFSHQEIIAQVWQNKPLTTSSDVTKYIYLLREKLEEDPDNPKYIVTVRGFGYKLASG